MYFIIIALICLDVDIINKLNIKTDNRLCLLSEMTTKLDDSVGIVVTALKDKGILNNTVIIFLSDNGAQTIGMHQNWGSNWPFRGVSTILRIDMLN